MPGAERDVTRAARPRQMTGHARLHFAGENEPRAAAGYRHDFRLWLRSHASQCRHIQGTVPDQPGQRIGQCSIAPGNPILEQLTRSAWHRAAKIGHGAPSLVKTGYADEPSAASNPSPPLAYLHSPRSLRSDVTSASAASRRGPFRLACQANRPAQRPAHVKTGNRWRTLAPFDDVPERRQTATAPWMNRGCRCGSGLPI